MTTQEISRIEPAWQPPSVPPTVGNSDDYVAVADGLKEAKAFERHVVDWFKPLKEKAYAAWRGLCDRERETLAPCQAWVSASKQVLSSFDQEQERIRREEERRLQEAARREEETRRLDEAAALEREATATGDEALQAEAEDLIARPIVAPPVMVPRSTPKVAGIVHRENWSARVVSLPMLIKYVAAHPEHQNLLTPNTAALNQLARAMKANLKIDGVQAVNTPTVAAGR